MRSTTRTRETRVVAASTAMHGIVYSYSMSPPLRPPQKNRHQMNSSTKKPIPPTGAHLRSSASRLIFRAAFRYLADSERSEVESVDMPAVGTHISTASGGTGGRRRTIQAISPPEQILHVLGHDPRDVLEVLVEPREVGRRPARCCCGARLGRPGVPIQPGRLGDEGVCGAPMSELDVIRWTARVPNPRKAYGRVALSISAP